MMLYRRFVWLLLFSLIGSVQAADKVDFSLPNMEGKVIKLSDYRGKWVVVNYWATWCPPCLEELPELDMLHTQSDGKIVVLGVNVEDISQKRLANFVEEQFLSFPILVATNRPNASQLVGEIPGMPTTYVISPQGEVAARQIGGITAGMVRRFIAKMEAK